MRNRPCARWCPRDAVRYDICCHSHWRQLSQWEREAIRQSYQRQYGIVFTMAQRTAETAAERRIWAQACLRG